MLILFYVLCNCILLWAATQRWICHIWSGIQEELVDHWRWHKSVPSQTRYHDDPKGLPSWQGAKLNLENHSWISQWGPGPEWCRCTAHVPVPSTASGLRPLYCWSIFHCHTFALEMKENIFNEDIVTWCQTPKHHLYLKNPWMSSDLCYLQEGRTLSESLLCRWDHRTELTHAGRGASVCLSLSAHSCRTAASARCSLASPPATTSATTCH